MRIVVLCLILGLGYGLSANAAAPLTLDRTIDPVQLTDIKEAGSVGKGLASPKQLMQPVQADRRARDIGGLETSALVIESQQQFERILESVQAPKQADRSEMTSIMESLPRRGSVEFKGANGTLYQRDGLTLKMKPSKSNLSRDVDDSFYAWFVNSSLLQFIYSSSFTANTWVGAVFVPSEDGIWPYKAVEYGFMGYWDDVPWPAVGVNRDNSWYPTSVTGLQFTNYYNPLADWAELNLKPYDLYFDSTRLALHGLVNWCSAGGACNYLAADLTTPNLIDWDHNSNDGGATWGTYTNVDWMMYMTVEVMPDTGDLAYYFPFPIGSSVEHNTCAYGANSGIADDYMPPSSGPYAVGGGLGPDLIYNIYPGANVALNITMTPTGFNGLIYLCTDYTDILNTTIAASNNAGTAAETLSNVAVTADTDYYLIVDGDGLTDCGEFTLNISAAGLAPGNNTCTNPTAITLPYTVTTDTYTATNNYTGEACGILAEGADRVYRYTPSVNQALAITLTPVDFDAAVYVSTVCPPVAPEDCVAAADMFGEYAEERIPCFLATAGTAYYIFVDGYEPDDKGAFTLTVETTTAPTNDTCPLATALTLDVDIESNTACSIDDYEGLCTGYSQLGPDIVYSYTPAANTTLALILDPIGWDASLYVVSACTPDMTTCVGAADLWGTSGSEYVCVDLLGLTTYYIVVDGYEVGGEFILYAQETVRPSNDTCDTAVLIPPIASDYYVYGDGYLSCGADDYDPTATGCTGSAQPGPDVVYKYTPSVNQNMTVMARAYYADWDVGIYITTNCADLSGCVGADNELSGVAEFIHCYPMTAGTTYYIIIDTPTEGLFGRYYFEFWPVSQYSNELCTNAETITSLPAAVFGDTSCANNDYSPTMGTCFSTSAPSGELVYKYTTGSLAETVSVILDPEFYTGSVYVVTNCSDLDNCVAGGYSNPPGTQVLLPCLAFAANTTYYIIVDGSLGADEQGRFMLYLEHTQVPTNDDCTTPQIISTFPTTIEADTYCAVSDYYYPPYYLLGNDLVYQVNVTTSGNYSFEFMPYDFDAGYIILEGICPTGTVVDGYLIVPAGNLASVPCLPLTAGTPYYILVAGDEPYDFGHFTLTVNQIGAIPSNDTCSSPINISSLPYTQTAYTNCAAGDYDPGDGGCANGFAQPGADVAYRYVTAAPVTLIVDVEAAHDCSVYILSPDCSDPVNNCVAGSDDYYGGVRERIVVDLPAGTYYIIVDSWDEVEAGAFTISVSLPGPIPTAGPIGIGLLILALTGALGVSYRRRIK